LHVRWCFHLTCLQFVPNNCDNCALEIFEGGSLLPVHVINKRVLINLMAEKRNIFLVGPMGAGKSTIGRELADKLHLEFFDSDQEIERRTGADIAWVFDLEGEEGFRVREESVIEDLSEKQGIVLATGGGSVISAQVRNRLSARGIVVYLETTIDKQVARTQRDRRRPLLQTDEEPRTVLENLAVERNPLYEEIADVIVQTDDQSAKVVASKIVERLDF
jgi:shikimate kinase